MKKLLKFPGLVCILSVLIFRADPVCAQLIKPMGKGFSSPAITVFVDSSQSIKLSLHKLHESKDSLLTRYLIKGWSGSDWVTLTSFVARVSDTTKSFDCVNRIAYYKAQFYVAGSFDSVGYPAIPNTARIARCNLSFVWNSLSTGIGNHPSCAINSLEVFGGKLYAGGKGFFLGTDSFMHILAWNSAQWNKVGVFGPDSVVYDLKRHNNKLLVAGRFLKADSGLLTQAVAAYDGTSWSALPGHQAPFSHDLEAIGDSIFSLTSLSPDHFIVQCYRGGAWNNMTHNLPQFPRQLGAEISIANVNQRLWLSTQTNDPAISLFYLRDTTWLPLPTEVLGYVRMVTARDSLIVWGSFSQNEGTFLDGIGIVKSDIPDLIRVRGTVFYDANEDCNFDAQDKAFANQKLRIKPGNYLAITNEKGEYHRLLPRAAYNIQIIGLPPGFDFFCSADSLLTDSIGTPKNFALKARATYRNNKVTMHSSAAYKAPKGRVQYLSVKVENKSIHTDSVILVFEYDSLLSWVSSNLVPMSKIKNRVMYKLSDLLPFSKKEISIGLRADSALAAYTPLFHKAYLLTSSGYIDSINSDDLDTLHQVVSAPLDPNDKQAWPTGDIQPETEKICYSIRFQNVGTDKAIRVRIVDTVDISLPLTDVWIEHWSHNNELYIEDNILTWVFNDINLPDSTSDSKGSQGFLTYYFNLNNGIAVGTKISNTAMIYFDYEAPVRTNTVVTTVDDDEESVDKVISVTETLKLYPNPASDYFMIENKDQKSSLLYIRDVMGRILWSGSIEAGSSLQVDASVFPDGLYFICTDSGQAARLVIRR